MPNSALTSPAIAPPVAECTASVTLEADVRGTRVEVSYDCAPGTVPAVASCMIYFADGSRPAHLDVPTAELSRLALALSAVARQVEATAAERDRQG